jgi:hypothetical protein
MVPLRWVGLHLSYVAMSSATHTKESIWTSEFFTSRTLIHEVKTEHMDFETGCYTDVLPLRFRSCFQCSAPVCLDLFVAIILITPLPPIHDQHRLAPPEHLLFEEFVLAEAPPVARVPEAGQWVRQPSQHHTHTTHLQESAAAEACGMLQVSGEDACCLPLFALNCQIDQC